MVWYEVFEKLLPLTKKEKKILHKFFLKPEILALVNLSDYEILILSDYEPLR